MSADVICLGHTALDYSWQVPALSGLPQGGGKCKADGFAQAGGGMAATAAVAVARLGLAVQFWGRAGADPAGKDMRAELEHWGVDVSYLRLFDGAQSSVSAIVVDAKGERLIINHRGQGLPGSADWLPLPDVKTAKAVLADPRWPEGAQALFTAAREYGVPTVLDGDVAEPAVYERLLPLTDHALFSEPGLAIWAAHIALGHTSIENQLRTVLAKGCRLAGVTQGEQGVQWLDATGLHHTPARPVYVVDTTGAGDVFHGAFAAALALGQDTPYAMGFASSTAALKCQYAGGRSGIPDMAQATAFYQTLED